MESYKIRIKEATKLGYAEAEVGDSINYSVPGSKTGRGRVGKGVAQTLDTACNQAVLTNDLGYFCPSPRKGGIRKKQSFFLRKVAFG